jgi:hypothetical protein
MAWHDARVTASSPPPAPQRSADPCPACGRHELALVQPPHIPVMGAQPYTELYMMGDLPTPVGVRCRACGTAWPTIEALRAGEPGRRDEIDPVEGLDAAPLDDDARPASASAAERRAPAPPLGRLAGGVVAAIMVVALLAVALWLGVFTLALVVMAVMLIGAAVRRRTGSGRG